MKPTLFRVREYDPATPNEAFVDFPNGYIEIGGSRVMREWIAEVIARALNAERQWL